MTSALSPTDRLGHAPCMGHRREDPGVALVLRDRRHSWAGRTLANQNPPVIVRSGVGRGLAVLVLLGVAIAGCGHRDDGVATRTGPDRPKPEQRYEITAMVSETASHGPQLCVGALVLGDAAAAGAAGPEAGDGCGGPDIAGWSWDAVDGETTTGSVTEGRYHVVGTFANHTLTLTEPPGPPGPPDIPVAASPLPTTPCPTPPGGWRIVDPHLATYGAIEALQTYTASQPDFGAIWLDNSINPAYDPNRQMSPEDAEHANDPGKQIYNVSFTGDLERHQRELRDIWGGPLCVSQAPRPIAEVNRVAEAIKADATQGGPKDWLSFGPDGIHGVVNLEVVADDGTLQRQMDDRFGQGAVKVTSAMHPVP